MNDDSPIEAIDREPIDFFHFRIDFSRSHFLFSFLEFSQKGTERVALQVVPPSDDRDSQELPRVRKHLDSVKVSNLKDCQTCCERCRSVWR